MLTGGGARRLGGADKAAVVVGGRTLASRVAEAVEGAVRVIAVGPVPPEFPPRTMATVESPPGGGPVAALAAGAALVTADEVAVVAIDMPFLSAATIDTLRRALAGTPGAAAALPVDEHGRDQPLCSVWRTARLRAALAGLGSPAGLPVRRLIEAAEPVARVSSSRSGALPSPWFDCDTPADVAEAESWAADLWR